MRVRAQEQPEKGTPSKQKALGAMQTKHTKQDNNNTRRGPTLRVRGAPLGPHSGEGRARSPVLALFGEIIYSGLLEKMWPQKEQKGKQKPQKRNTETPLPPRVQKGPRKGRTSSCPASSRRIQKKHGAQNGTPRTHQEKGCTAKTGDKPNAAGQKGEKQQTNNKCVWECPVTTRFFFLEKEKKRKGENDVNEKNLRKRE